MPRKPNKEQVSCQFFRWLLGARNNVFYADGRSGNACDLGRHSLATRDHEEALKLLRRLDLVKAVEFGLAKEDLLKNREESLLSLEEGRDRYLEFVKRPLIQGGVTPSTLKRYRAVLAKFLPFATEKKICAWQQVNKQSVCSYGAWLDDQDYAPRTQHLELTVLAQVVKWLADEKFLPASCLFSLDLRKPHGTTTYCYSPAEVQAIIAFCRSRADLGWLADLVVALATTGLRISEVAALRWSDLDPERSVLHLKDTRHQVSKSKRKSARTTKSHRDRMLPLREELTTILRRLPILKDGLVFHGPKAGKIKPDTVRNILIREVLPALAEKFPRYGDNPGILAGRLHSFRHYFCSMAADNGVPEQMLMAWLGHRDSAMIRHYYHLRPDVARTQMSKIPFLGQSPKVLPEVPDEEKKAAG